MQKPKHSPLMTTLLALALIAEDDATPKHLREQNVKAIIESAIAVLPLDKVDYWKGRILKTKTASGKIAICKDIISYWEKRPQPPRLANPLPVIDMPNEQQGATG